MQEDGTLPVVVEADFDHFIAARRDLLAARLAAADRKARGGLLPQVTLGDLVSGPRGLRGSDGLVAVESRPAWPAVRWPLSRTARRKADGLLSAGSGQAAFDG